MKTMTQIKTMAQPSSFGMSASGYPTFGATTPSFVTGVVVRERISLIEGVDGAVKANGRKRTHADWGSPAWSSSSC